jgi:hypothetical protein
MVKVYPLLSHGIRAFPLVIIDLTFSLNPREDPGISRVNIRLQRRYGTDEREQASRHHKP